MDPQFEELASRLTKDISFKVDEAVSAAEERIDLRFSRRLEEAKNELKQHAQSNLEERLEEAKDELKQHGQSNLEEVNRRLEEAKNELKHQAQLNQEELKERITMAADGFAGTLESIKRQLDELNSKVDTKFADHGSILADHHQRITTLERHSST